MSKRNRAKTSKRQRRPLIGTMEQPYADMVDGASQQDRLWFEQHPGEDQYVRSYRAGEFKDLVPPTNMLVLVTKINENLRIRSVVPPDVADLARSGVRIFTPEELKIQELLAKRHKHQ